MKYYNHYDNYIANSKEEAIAHNLEHFGKLYYTEWVEEYTDAEVGDARLEKLQHLIEQAMKERAEEDFDLWEEA